MKKLVKIHRYLRSRLRPKSALPLYWHIGRPNFGDDFNPDLFELLSGRSMRLEVHRDRPHFLGMGSILERARPETVVLGSGFIAAPTAKDLTVKGIVSVRGELTRRHLTPDRNILLGDPMVLLDQVLPVSSNPSDIVGFVPHVSEVKAARKLGLPDVKIIDPGHNPMKVLLEIGNCKRIFSQSLHGLIVADALRVPNCWIGPSAKMKGGTFKFADYYSTMDHKPEPLEFCRETFTETPRSQFHAGVFQHDKRVYRDAISEALNSRSFL